MAANLIEENLFAQVDLSGNQFTILDSITLTRIDGAQVLHQDAFVHTSPGTKKRLNTTKVWEICIQWKYGSTTCNKLKDVKYLYPVHMAEFAVDNRISEEPPFAWWV